MDADIRALTPNEYPLLEDFLYHAIFLPPGVAPPPREILQDPALRVYVDGFGTRPGDFALGAAVGGQIVGAVWCRIMQDYGHIDDETPSFAISLLPAHRGRGIGTALMRAMLDTLRAAGYAQCSLAVQKENYAVRMYRRVGFTVVDENAQEYIMLCRL